MNAYALPASTSFATLSLDSLDTALKLAQFVAKSGFFPAYKSKPDDAAMAILFGQSLGLSWGHSLLNIAVINGRPTLWGDALLALCKKSPDFDSCHETFDKETMTASCEVKRKGEKAQVRTFSKSDAIQAKLWGRNTWVSYPQRMLQMRARAFALRDVFPHVLQGLGCAEEVQDYSESIKPQKSDSRNVIALPVAQENVEALKQQLQPCSLLAMRQRREEERQKHRWKSQQALARVQQIRSTAFSSLTERKTPS